MWARSWAIAAASSASSRRASAPAEIDQRGPGEAGGGEHDVVAADDDAALRPASQRCAHEPAHGERGLRHPQQRPHQRGGQRQPAERRGGMAGHLVVRRARPLGEGAQQMPGVQQHQRSRHRPDHDERPQGQRGGPQQQGSGRIGPPEREQVR